MQHQFPARVWLRSTGRKIGARDPGQGKGWLRGSGQAQGGGGGGGPRRRSETRAPNPSGGRRGVAGPLLTTCRPSGVPAPSSSSAPLSDPYGLTTTRALTGPTLRSAAWARSCSPETDPPRQSWLPFAPRPARGERGAGGRPATPRDETLTDAAAEPARARDECTTARGLSMGHPNSRGQPGIAGSAEPARRTRAGGGPTREDPFTNHDARRSLRRKKKKEKVGQSDL